VKRYEGPGRSLDIAADLRVSPDGSTVFVTGQSGSKGGYSDFATIAYDSSTGAKRWLARFNGPGNASDSAVGLAVSPDGTTVFVTGWSRGADDTDYATVAYDASTGVRQWVTMYNGPDDAGDAASALGVSPDGSTVFVTGSSWGSLGLADCVTIAYDTSTGTQRWVKRYDGPSHDTDVAHALTMSASGSMVFVTGSSNDASGVEDYATLAYDASTGAKLWVKRYDGPPHDPDVATAIGASPDGSTVFVTGYSTRRASLVDYVTIAYDAPTGAKRWLKRYDGPASSDDWASALAVSPDGSAVFITGNSYGSGNEDYATVAYDALTGSERWVGRYNGPGNGGDFAQALSVSPDGLIVWVTGFSDGLTSGGTHASDFATIAYDVVGGTQDWVGRFDGPAHTDDSAFALGIRPDGSAVFVTGYSVASNGWPDYATVAYAIT
jgi:hypothetical protein